MRRSKNKLEQNLKQIFARQDSEPDPQGEDAPDGTPLDFLTQDRNKAASTEEAKKPPAVQKPEEKQTETEAVAETKESSRKEPPKKEKSVAEEPAISVAVVAESQPAPAAQPDPAAIEPVQKQVAALAKVKQMASAADTLRKVLVFRLGEGFFGVSVFRVQTIIKPQPVYPVPGTEEFIIGLINLRGEVVPMIDLRIRFGLPQQEMDDKTRFVVIEYGEYLASMIVDEVMGVENIPEDHFQKPSGVVMDVDTQYLDEIVHFNERLILILNLNELIARKDHME